MYNFQDCGEDKKASLSADDVAAICAVYPKSKDPTDCQRVISGGGCCSAARAPLGLVPVLSAFLLGFFVLRPRRRKNRVRA
jgi:hypothetical protein